MVSDCCLLEPEILFSPPNKTQLEVKAGPTTVFSSSVPGVVLVLSPQLHQLPFPWVPTRDLTVWCLLTRCYCL